MSDKFVGEVVWFDARRGYGFISWDKNGVKQKDLFLHFSDISVEGFKTVNKGQKVEFSLGQNKNGVPKATEVAPIVVA
jgi:CspA family cold shock protein